MSDPNSNSLSVKIPKNMMEFNGILQTSYHDILVIIFEISECVPCDTIFVRIKNALQNFQNLCVVRIDIAKLPEVTQEYDIRGVPTIIALKENEEMDRFVGMKDEESIRKFVVQAKEEDVKARIGSNTYHIKSEQEFENLVLKSPKTALVDFYATWCIPCTLLAPLLDTIFKEYSRTRQKMIMVKIDCDEAQELAIKYNVNYLPTLILFKNGKEINRLSGMQSEETIMKLLEEGNGIEPVKEPENAVEDSRHADKE